MMICEINSHSLPVRPRPVQGEATIGFLMRVALANGYETPRQLWIGLRTFDAVCKALCLSAEEENALFGPFPSYWGHNDFKYGLTAADFNHSLMRWCPLCLRESAHLRGQWMLKLCCVCSRHSIRLLDRCPICGSTQRLERANFDRCICGAWFANAQYVETDVESVVRITQTLEASIFDKVALPSLPSLSAQEWLRLISYLGQFSETLQPAKPGKNANMHQLDTAMSLMLNVGKLLDNWPENFHAILEAIQRKEPAKLSIRRTFGPMYRVLYVDLAGGCFQFLRDEFECYLHEYWRGVVSKRNKAFKPETVTTHPRFTLKQAAQKTGVAPAIVRHIMQSELISDGLVVLPSGRKVRSIHKSNLTQIKALTNGCMTIGEAAMLLALPERRVRELISSGIIMPLISRVHDKSAAWLIAKQQVQGLFFTGSESRNVFSVITVRRLLKYWHLRDGEFMALVQALSESRLLPVALQSIPVPLGNVTLDEQEARKWLEEVRFQAGSSMSVDEAAKRLCLKQQVVYDLVRRGLLVTIEDKLPGRRVMRTSLEDFQATYISLAEFSRSLQRAPRWVLKKLRVPPISGPLIDGSRQYFFRRSDVCAEKLPAIVK